jgi:hypothetical protein
VLAEASQFLVEDGTHGVPVHPRYSVRIESDDEN